MADQLDLFSPSLAPIKWRRPSAATFFIVESRAPADFEICCVTIYEKPANPTPTYVAGKLVAEIGAFYQALHWKGGAPIKSPLYGSLEEAKAACETYRHMGAFPERDVDGLGSE